MKNIVLFCAAGASTSVMVGKMQDYAKANNLEYQISAHSVNEEAKYGNDADVIFLGPQVRFHLNNLKNKYAGKPVEAIPFQIYGSMDGEYLIKRAQDLLGD